AAHPSPVAEQTQQTPQPIAMAPAQTAEKSAPSEPAKDTKRELKPAPVEQIASAQLKDESAKENEPALGAPAPASLDAPGRTVSANTGLALGKTKTRSANGLVAAKQDSAAADSLFDHSYDMEFALDPVRLSKSGKGKLSPSRPSPTELQGKPAKVTF